MNLITRRELNGSVFDELFSDFFNRAGWTVPARTAELPAAVRARMDVVDKGDKYAVSVDLPGVRKEDIQVNIDGARVAITAENKNEREVKDGAKVLHTERYATSYARSFELPAEVTDEGADAAFENGVLRLTLPKRAQVMSKRLAVR
ncbi:MAG TPA: Hsp20 family protein [Burkholderiaceae bacterium]|nr:Hsp20 family protein [Burkholderiaceae bacterium]